MMGHFRRRPEIIAFITVFGFFLALLPHWTSHLDPLTGDEPFYIMTAISIIEDFDLDESNNYEVVEVPTESGTTILYRFDRDLYPPDPLPPDWQGWASPPDLVGPHAATTERDGYYTKHGLGLSFLIALPYAILGRIGANLLLISFAALLASQMYLLARDTGAGTKLALALTVSLAVLMPLGPYALLLFPEIPAALLVVYAVRRVAVNQNATWQWLLAGGAVGFLPWLHQRFAFTAVVLALIALAYIARIRSRRDLVAFAAPVFVGAATLLTYNQWLYGIPIQRVEDHAGFSGVRGTINGAFGLLLDAQWGLVIAAPVTIIAIATAPTLFSRLRGLWRITMAACLPYLIVVAAYSVWWGEWGPPARYLVPVVPFAIVPLGAWLRRHDVLNWSMFAILLLPGIALTLVGYSSPQRFYHHPDGHNQLVAKFDSVYGTDIAGKLISFQPFAIDPLAERVWISILMVGVATGLCILYLLSTRTTTTLSVHSAQNGSTYEDESTDISN